MPRKLLGGLNDARGKRYHGQQITFRTSDSTDWKSGVVNKRPLSCTVIDLADHKIVLGWQVTEFVINGLPNPK